MEDRRHALATPGLAGTALAARLREAGWGVHEAGGTDEVVATAQHAPRGFDAVVVPASVALPDPGANASGSGLGGLGAATIPVFVVGDEAGGPARPPSSPRPEPAREHGEEARALAGSAGARTDAPSFLDALPVAAYRRDRRPGSITPRFLGRAFERLTGHPTAACLEEGFLEGRLHPDERPDVLERAALPDGAPELDEYRLRAADGSWMWLRDERRLVPTGERGEHEIVGVWSDVTERRRREASEQRARRSLREQIRDARRWGVLGRTASTAAPDLEGLVIQMASYTDFAADSLGQGRAGRAADQIGVVARACERVRTLAHQLLMLAHHTPAEPAGADVNELVRDLRGILQEIVGEDVGVVEHLEAARPSVDADPGELERILLDVALNARDAMPEGGRLELGSSDLAGGERDGGTAGVRLHVRDSAAGHGLDPDTWELVFEPFFTSRAGDRPAMGLAAARHNLRRLGGELRVTHETGSGTAVFMDVPARGAASDRQDRAGGSRVRELDAPTTVLLVDDDRRITSLVRRTLERDGYRVLTSYGGHEALRVARSHAGVIDLLLVDVLMPDMHGLRLARTVHRERPSVRILFMTGYGGEEDAAALVGDEGAPLLGKPFTPERLLERVRRALDAPADDLDRILDVREVGATNAPSGSGRSGDARGNPR